MTFLAILIPVAFAFGYCLGRAHNTVPTGIEPMPKGEIIAFETLRARRAERETSK